MKICIPTRTKDGKKAEVFGHFGSAPCFTIYDTQTDQIEIIENADQHHSHGMCQPMATLAGKQIGAVVCGGMGVRAVQKLNESGIKAYRAADGTVEQILQQQKSGTLEEITVLNACAQHRCS